MAAQMSRKGRVIREGRPRWAGMDFRLLHLKAANVDSVESEHGQTGRKTAWREAARRGAENLRHTQTLHQLPLCTIAPIVKVPGNNQWGLRFGMVLNIIGQRVHLAFA